MNLPRLSLGALLCVLLSLPLGRALAQSSGALTAPPAPGAKQEPLRRFSFGAGVGTVFAGDPSGLGFYQGAGIPATGGTPVGIALVEVAWTRALRLSLGAQGSYFKRRGDDNVGRENWVSSSNPHKASSVGVGVGPRWIFNPGDLVEISTLITFGFHRASSAQRTQKHEGTDIDGEPIYSHYTTDVSGIGMDARLGLVLEYALLPRLHLRFDNQLLRGGFDWYRSRTDSTDALGSSTRSSGSQGSLAFGWAPFLMLRLSL